MQAAQSFSSRLPRGLSFPLSDLVLAQSWSDFHGLRMTVRLDHGSDDEEYEEILAFYGSGSLLCWCFFWRDAQSVFVQPMIGRQQRFDLIEDALESLIPKRKVVATDIKPVCLRIPVIVNGQSGFFRASGAAGWNEERSASI
jgi:hypothetical protein